MFAAKIRGKRAEAMRAHHHLQWRWDDLFQKINGLTHYLGSAVDHEGAVPESIVTRIRNRNAAPKFLQKSMKRHGRGDEREIDHWLNYRAEYPHLPFQRRERAMLRFRRIRTLQTFALVHASVHNHFPTKRHLQDRSAWC
jgi:putative transposase